MNKQVLSKFCEVLESETYEQTTDALAQRGCFCAMGVLCDMYIKEVNPNCSWRKVHPYDVHEAFVDETGIEYLEPPADVLEWAGLDKKYMHKIIDWNDCDCLAFDEIAYYIREDFKL